MSSMRILFCNIAYMKYYKGKIKGVDVPQGGGEYVDRTGNAHEKYNFLPEMLTFREDYLPEGEYCLGFVETKTTKGDKVNQIHIENIDGCGALKNEPEVDDVLVIFCAKYPDSEVYESVVVGWYKHAKVLRDYDAVDFMYEDGSEYRQYFNILARKEDCVLLPPSGVRRKTIWKAQRKKKGVSYGFGQSNIWFATGADGNPYLKNYLDNLISNIENYDGENWLERYPEGFDYIRKDEE